MDHYKKNSDMHMQKTLLLKRAFPLVNLSDDKGLLEVWISSKIIMLDCSIHLSYIKIISITFFK